MGKVIALLLLTLSAVASMAGYLYLTEKINTGEKQIAEGQIQLKKGQLELHQGKEKLAAGKQELLQGKQEYEQTEDNFFLVLADKLLQRGKGFESAREQIADGESQIAKGEDKINAGAKRLDAGELQLHRGMEQLRLARSGRIACAIGTIFFTTLSIVLAIYWRQSLSRIFKH
jgi:chromosome segregation ATPase